MTSIIVISAPIIESALAHQAEQSAVTFLYGPTQLYIEGVLNPRGECIDPDGAHAALSRLNKAFTAAGWGSALNLAHDGDIISAVFNLPREKTL
jgi:hypothetical protein